MRLSVLLLALIAVHGCGRPKFDTPKATYTNFHQWVQLGDYKKAWTALSQPTQQALTARAAALSKASGGTLRADPAELFFLANVPPPAEYSQVTLRSEEAGQALLDVAALDSKSEIRLVREPDGWKIDLTHSLTP